MFKSTLELIVKIGSMIGGLFCLLLLSNRRKEKDDIEHYIDIGKIHTGKIINEEKENDKNKSIEDISNDIDKLI